MDTIKKNQMKKKLKRNKILYSFIFLGSFDLKNSKTELVFIKFLYGVK